MQGCARLRKSSVFQLYTHLGITLRGVGRRGTISDETRIRVTHLALEMRFGEVDSEFAYSE